MKSIQELKTKLEDIKKEDFSPTLAISFASDSFSGKEVGEILSSLGVDVFGSSSREEISGNELNINSISILLLDIPKSAYRICLFSKDDSVELGKKISDWVYSEFKKPQLLLAVGGAGMEIIGDDLLEGLFYNYGIYPVFGGLASALTDTYRPFVFTGQNSERDAVLGLALNGDEISIQGTTISGWEEIGTPKVVTKSEGNYVYEINREPALELYKKYFQIYGNMDEQFLISEYPISLLRKDGSRAIRTAVSIDGEKKAIHYGGQIPEGSLIRFCTPNIAKAIENTIQELNEFINTKQVSHPSVIILFDCAIRSRSLGIHMKKEIQFISELWQVPMIGFASWGEIGGNRQSSCDFHNTTIAIALITEIKKPGEVKKIQNNYSEERVRQILESSEVQTTDIQELKSQVIRLQKEKTILSNFLYYTSRDLDEATLEIKKEREKSENLLRNILPESIAERLKKGETSIADNYTEASILFADLVGFTSLSTKISPAELVSILNLLFTGFDEITSKMNSEKIKTIGDAYMVVSGLPEPNENHAENLFLLGRHMLEFIQKYNSMNKTSLNIRIGINSGNVIAGVLGTKKISYDLWGDAVNTASRMESSGVPGKIHISESTYKYLKDNYKFEERGEIEVKGKGKMKTYLY